MRIDVDGELLDLLTWADMDAAVSGVGRGAELVVGPAADLGSEAVSLSRRDGAGAVVMVAEAGATPTMLATPWAGRLWWWQGHCVLAVRPEPWAAFWRELQTPVVSLRAFDRLPGIAQPGAMGVVCEDGVLLLSAELETVRSWPTDLVTGVEWQADGVRVSQWDADPLDVRFC